MESCIGSLHVEGWNVVEYHVRYVPPVSLRLTFQVICFFCVLNEQTSSLPFVYGCLYCTTQMYFEYCIIFLSNSTQGEYLSCA